jgi:hypothetical protein
MFELLKLIIMKDYREINTDNWRNDFSTEYYLIRKATSKELRKNTIKIIGLAAATVAFGYVFMYAMLYAFLAIYYA